MTNKYKTNEQKFKAICKDENPMVQCFIIDAAVKQAQAVLAQDSRPAEWSENAFVSWDLWKHCAEQVIAQFASQE